MQEVCSPRASVHVPLRPAFFLFLGNFVRTIPIRKRGILIDDASDDAFVWFLIAATVLLLLLVVGVMIYSASSAVKRDVGTRVTHVVLLLVDDVVGVKVVRCTRSPRGVLFGPCWNEFMQNDRCCSGSYEGSTVLAPTVAASAGAGRFVLHGCTYLRRGDGISSTIERVTCSFFWPCIPSSGA